MRNKNVNDLCVSAFIVSSLRSPAVPLNAKVRTVTADTGIGFAEAHYECDAGYELFGPASVKCDARRGWERDLPFCGVNVAYRKPVNQSSYTRSGPASYANDGKPGNKVGSRVLSFSLFIYIDGFSFSP